MSTSSLLLGVLFSCVGFGYFLYGRKQRSGVPLVCGMALMAIPYLIANAVVLLLVGLALAAAPYVLRE